MDSPLLRLIFLVCVDLLYSVQCTNPLDQVHWTDELIVVREGDNFNISCTAGNMTQLDVIRLSRSHKSYDHRYDDEDDDEDDDESFGGYSAMVDSHDVKVPYLNIPRYWFGHKVNQSSGTVHFAIKGVHGKDAGLVKCFKLGTDSGISTVEIRVMAPVKDSGFVAREKSGKLTPILADATELILKSDTHNGFGCRAVTYDPSNDPSISIRLNGSKLDGALHKKLVKKVAATEKDVSYLSSEVSVAFSRGRKLSALDHGKVLDCLIETNNFPAKRHQIKLNIQHPPIIKSCSSSPARGHGYWFSCTVRSNPAFSVKILKFETSEVVKYNLTEQSLSSNTMNFTVTLFDTDPEDIYVLQLTNPIGSKEKRFDFLKEGQSIDYNNDEVDDDDVGVSNGDIMTSKKSKYFGLYKGENHLTKDLDHNIQQENVIALGSQSSAVTLHGRLEPLLTLVLLATMTTRLLIEQAIPTGVKVFAGNQYF